jgi:hypothetical protein
VGFDVAHVKLLLSSRELSRFHHKYLFKLVLELASVHRLIRMVETPVIAHLLVSMVLSLVRWSESGSIVLAGRGLRWILTLSLFASIAVLGVLLLHLYLLMVLRILAIPIIGRLPWILMWH